MSVTSFPMGMVRSLAAVVIHLVNDTERMTSYRKTTVRKVMMELFSHLHLVVSMSRVSSIPSVMIIFPSYLYRRLRFLWPPDLRSRNRSLNSHSERPR